MSKGSMEEEIWKEVLVAGQPATRRYEVSSLGNFKFCSYVSSEGYTFKERITQGSDNGRGYKRVLIGSKSFRVHRLVAQAFIPNPENKEVVNHKNGKKWDNRVSNLEWSTKQENSQHSTDSGLHHKGSKHRGSKLTEKEVLEILGLLDLKISNKEIAEVYGVTSAQISQIKRGRTWKHVPRSTSGN